MATQGRKPSFEKARNSKEPYVPAGEVGSIVIDVTGKEIMPTIRDSEGNVIVPPELLTEGGMDVWNAVIPDLVNSGVFRSSDALMLVEMCEMLSQAQRYRRRSQEIMDRLDMAIDEGNLESEVMFDAMLKRTNTAHEKALTLALRMATEFGISPVARVKLGLARVKGASLLSSFSDDD